MAVNLNPPGDLLPVPGVRLGVAEAAIKRPGRPDVTVLEFAENTQVAAVFTQNAFAAAPVVIARQRVAAGAIRALLINSGNANAGTGAAGHRAAMESCRVLAEQLSIVEQGVLPFSTGVIGEQLPLQRLCDALPEATGTLSDGHWSKAASAIMTTDTLPKAASRRVKLPGGRDIVLTGMSKGAGMIRPNMATMLAFVATDAPVDRSALQSLLASVTKRTFNSITIDGDTSTNDACVLAATGQAGGETLVPGQADWPAFAEAVEDLLRQLAQAIVRDGEGATRFIAVQVDRARNEDEARQVAFTVAHSPLVKTACFAGDPNWGRILAAVGRAGLDELEIARVDISLGAVRVVTAGEPDADYVEAQAAAVMAQSEYEISISLGRGDAATTVWTTDLSYDYVKINAEYRS